MGLMSAGGLYVQLYAMRIAPREISLIALISGMWPVATVIVVGILRMGNPLLPRQWLGVVFAGVGLALVNWT
jgi:drug/metabolite transporter (DMT)-like permease